MKASIIFFLLGISASTVLSNPTNGMEVRLENIGANLERTITDIMNPLGIEYEDVKELGSKTLTAFNTMIKAAADGKYDERAVDDMTEQFKNVILAMNDYIGYKGDDLSIAIKTKIEGLKKATAAAVDGTISDVFKGLHEDMSGYSDICAILSAAVNVDVSVKVGEMNEYFHRLIVSIYRQNNNDYSDAVSAAEEFSGLFAKIIAKFLKALGIDDDQDFSELVKEIQGGFQGTVVSAADGKYDEKSVDKTIEAWRNIMSALNEELKLNEKELFSLINDAGVGYQDSAEGAASRSLSKAATGVKRALSGYIGAFKLLAEKAGVDISDELYKSQNANYACFLNYGWDSSS